MPAPRYCHVILWRDRTCLSLHDEKEVHIDGVRRAHLWFLGVLGREAVARRVEQLLVRQLWPLRQYGDERPAHSARSLTSLDGIGTRLTVLAARQHDHVRARRTRVARVLRGMRVDGR